MNFAFATPKATSTMKEIRIIGNRHFTDGEIQSWLSVRKGDAISEKETRAGAQGLLEQFRDRGYYFCQIDSLEFQYSSDSSQVELSLHLNEGPRVKVHRLRISGTADSSQILEELRTRPGRYFQHQVLDDDMDGILRYFEERGFPYCQVSVAQLDFSPIDSVDEATVDLGLRIEPGPAVAIGDVEIRGNDLTKDHVILRETGIKIGETYDQRQIDRIAPRLLRLGYFKWVNPPKIEWQPDETGRLIIELAEGSSNRFDGVLGYNPPAQNSSGFVSGLIDISFGNLLGTGRQVEARWERRTAKTQQLRFRYVEPWVAGLRMNAAVSFEQLIQDTIFVQRELGMNLRLRFSESLSLISYVSRRDISPDSVGQVLFGIPASHSTNVGVGLSLNTLDYPLNPQKGILYETTFEWGRKTIDGIDDTADASFNQKRIAIDFETYFSLFRWQVFAVGLHGRQITSGEPDISITDQYRFGGARTLRGYREEQFRGARIAWSNIEYRYLLNRTSRFFVFVDTGYFYREERPAGAKRAFEDALIGYGVGLRLDTALGFFGIDYALGEGDGLSNGKVHISLTNEF
jgi:outer membrane protein insertion porin family